MTNAASNNLRLLLVEDHSDTARMLTRLLGLSGFKVEIADSAGAALDLAAREPFDLLLCDIGLPDGSGYELMQTMRAQHGMKGIAMSGYGMAEDLRRSRDAGFSEHLVKPVNLDHLEQAIQRTAQAP